MDENKLIESLNQNLEMTIPANSDLKYLHHLLSVYVNQLIHNDFEKLVRLLYKIDVNEMNLKQVLKENPDVDTSPIIANLIIERQLQKIKSREQFKQNDNDSNLPENEKW